MSNLTEKQDKGGWAKYLPAISGFYTIHLGKNLSIENFVPKERVPEKFEYGIDGLDFLKKENSYFHYGYGLYSAGHAERNLLKCDNRESMIHKRDRKNTIVVGDSGGFQIATGVIKLDWATIKGPAGDKLREEILRFLEHTADWSMTLDVPAFAATEPFSKKTGLTKFSDTLDITVHNLHYFMKNRIPGKTKFLNVLSGSSPETSKEWYNTVKHFSDANSVAEMGYEKERTLEGFAFAGINMRNMSCTLERLLNLRDDNLLHNKDWIHFLGVGRLDWACYLTSIERQLKKHHNPNINISFDAASPFVATGGYALSYNYNHFDPNRLTYSMSKGLDNKKLKGTKFAMPFSGPIMDRLVSGDICVMGPNDPNKFGKICKTSWDSTSYALIMAHNVYNHIHAVQEINRLADIEYQLLDINYKDWMRGNKTKSLNLGEFVPNSILFFNNFVEVLFHPDTKNPYELIKENSAFLNSISFGNNKHSNFGDLFATTDVLPEIDELVSLDNDLLDQLENE